MHDGDLRDILGGHDCLVVEDTAKVIAVRENVGLKRQIRAARVHYTSINRWEETHIDAGEAILLGDFLGSQVLLHRDRVVRSSLHRGIVCHNHAVVTIDSGNSIRRTHESGQFRSQYRHSRLPPCTAPLRRVQIVRGRGSPDREDRRCVLAEAFSLSSCALQWPSPRRPSPLDPRGSSTHSPSRCCIFYSSTPQSAFRECTAKSLEAAFTLLCNTVETHRVRGKDALRAIRSAANMDTR